MSKNRRRGHDTERLAIKMIASLFNLISFNGKNFHDAEIGTSRMFSHFLDACKIDVWFKDNYFQKYAIQIKQKVIQSKSKNNIDVSPLFEMRTDENSFRILMTRLKYKANKNTMEKGWFITMPYEDWKRLIEEYEELKCEANERGNRRD